MLTEMERALLAAVTRMEQDYAEREHALRQTMHDLTERVSSLAAQVNALHALLQRAVHR